jgi:hypothetical protein
MLDVADCGEATITSTAAGGGGPSFFLFMSFFPWQAKRVHSEMMTRSLVA